MDSSAMFLLPENWPEDKEMEEFDAKVLRTLPSKEDGKKLTATFGAGE